MGLSLVDKILLLIGIMLGFALIYLFCYWDTKNWHGLEESQDVTWMQKFNNRLYFSVSTMTTTGSNVHPRVTSLRYLCMFQQCILFLGLLSLLHINISSY